MCTGTQCCIRSLPISGDTSEVYHYIIPLYSHLDLRPEPLHLPVCGGVKGSTVFQIHFSHLYGKQLEEDSKKGEEKAEESEITKALVVEPVTGRDHRVAGEQTALGTLQ